MVMEVAKQDISKLVAAGWVPPGADHGEGARRQDRSLWLHVQADELRCFEEVSDRQPCLSRAADRLLRKPRALQAAHGDMQSLAELGFIVVCIDGMGTPWRSKAFHEAYYGDLGDNTIPDQVSGMKDLAAKYPWIDLDRAGMYGHSGGGNATPRRCSTIRTSSRSASPRAATTTSATTKTTGRRSGPGCW